MSGPFTSPKESAAETLADVTAFRTFVGAASRTEADGRIHRPQADDRVDEGNNPLAPRPRAILNQGPSVSRKKLGDGTWVTTEGNLFLSFEKDVPAHLIDDPRASLAAFEEEIDDIMLGLEALAGSGTAPNGSTTYFNLTGWQLVDGPGRSEPEEEDGELFHGVAFLITWS